MVTATVIRWTPVDHTPELPLSAFNLTWSAEGRLVLQGLYPSELNPPTKGIVLLFSNTHAFMSFDEYSDYLDGMKVEIDDLGEQVAAPDLWDDVERATSITGRLSTLQGTLDRFHELETRIEDAGLEATRPVWEQALVSEDAQVYRAEYLAYQFMQELLARHRLAYAPFRFSDTSPPRYAAMTLGSVCTSDADPSAIFLP